MLTKAPVSGCGVSVWAWATETPVNTSPAITVRLRIFLVINLLTLIVFCARVPAHASSGYTAPHARSLFEIQDSLVRKAPISDHGAQEAHDRLRHPFRLGRRPVRDGADPRPPARKTRRRLHRTANPRVGRRQTGTVSRPEGGSIRSSEGVSSGPDSSAVCAVRSQPALFSAPADRRADSP